MDSEEYRKKIEEDVVKIIGERLKAHKMNADRAREIARYILDTLHPHMDINQIHAVVQNFDDHFSELIPIVARVSQEYEEEVKKIVLKHVDTLLKQNKIIEANELLKKALNKQVPV